MLRFLILLFFITTAHAATHRPHIYLKCKGTGSPTVILESGYRNDSDVWTMSLNGKPAIFPAIASFTRVCVYDRPNTIGATIKDLSRSDKIKMPRTPESVVEELHSVLLKAHVQKPYLLVGHSLGGIFIRLYAALYPHDVAGLVLVDAYPETFKSYLGHKYWQAYLTITKPAPEGLEHYNIENINFDDVTRVMENTEKNSPLPSIPLTVISRGVTADLPEQAQNILPSAAFEKAWQEGQNQLVLLSPHAKHIIAKKSQHYVQATEPELIINSIHEMVDEIRNAKRH